MINALGRKKGADNAMVWRGHYSCWRTQEGESLVLSARLDDVLCFALVAALVAYLIKVHEGIVGKAEYVNEVGDIFTNLFIVDPF